MNVFVFVFWCFSDFYFFLGDSVLSSNTNLVCSVFCIQSKGSVIALVGVVAPVFADGVGGVEV